MPKFTVTLNGTDTNPFHRMGFKQNPLPQLARHADAMRRVQKLAGDPIPNAAYIRETLAGFSEEFVELCCSQFVKGQKVSFDVEFPG